MGSGGTDKSAQYAQISANRETLALQKELATQARRDASKLFPAAQDNFLLGQKAAMSIFGQAAPQQINAFQQGNVNAQSQIARGMPQFQNALMGIPVDYGAFQPIRQQVDTGWMQPQMPQFTSTVEALRLTPEEIRAQLMAQQQQALAMQQAQAQAQAQQPSPYLSREDWGNGGGRSDSDRSGGTSGGGRQGGGRQGGGRNSAGGARGDGPGGSV